MKTVVCIKAVPSTTNVRLDPVTHTLIRDGKQSVVNPFDSAALEQAIRIREELGGSVTVVSMGIPAAEGLLRDCLSRGADEGVLLSDRAFAGADTLATSYALGCELKKQEPFSLILCGKMAVDGDTAQIGPEIAGMLGIPCITDVENILEISEESITVRRRMDGGTSVVSCRLPAVITVAKDICIPRMPSIAGVRRGETGTVRVETAQTLGANPGRCGLAGSPTQVKKVFLPERNRECRRLTGTAREQAETLKTLVESYRDSANRLNEVIGE